MKNLSVDDAKNILETTVAYLRLGLQEGGIPLKIKGGYDQTLELQNLIQRGEMTILRASRTTRMPVHKVFTSPQGIERLADIDRRYGESFGKEKFIPKLKIDKNRRKTNP